MTAKKQGGIGLLEVLIAIVILSIGFLASARMQAQSLRFSQSAYFQSQANLIATEVIDRMRANSGGVSGGNYDNQTVNATSAEPPVNCSTSSCSPQNVASSDLANLGLQLQILPSATNVQARGVISDDGDNQYTVSIFWAEMVNGSFEERTVALSFVAEGS